MGVGVFYLSMKIYPYNYTYIYIYIYIYIYKCDVFYRNESYVSKLDFEKTPHEHAMIISDTFDKKV